MSKKKAFSGSTMTLKDFHGGSIPSDLPLPSAPGAVVRPADRSGFDRHTSWGNPTGRPDYRSRPNSSPAARNFDDKSPFLAHTAHIGRNFDEDERKPLDGVSAPRRTVSDEYIHVPPTRLEPKADYTFSGMLVGRQAPTPLSQLPSSSASSYSARSAEATLGGSAHVGVSPGNSMVHGGQVVSGSYPNAWAARKEAVGIAEPGQSAWSGSVAESKFAQASALEKVSSGRWQSKLTIPHQPDVEVIRHSETESSLHTKAGVDNYALNGMDVVNRREHYDASLARHAERGLTIEDGHRISGRDSAFYGNARSNTHREAKDRNPQSYNDGIHSSPTNGKFSRSEFQPPMPSDPADRPKLKLLPLSKRLDGLEQPIIDYKMGHNWTTSDSIHTETVTEVYGNANPARPVLAGSETESRAAERPKLNLKPRTQPLERLEGNVERERNTLFGGARPRELVLKERGIDEVVINNHDLGQSSIRLKHDSPKGEMNPGNAVPIRYNEKATNLPLDDRIGKSAERKDHKVEVDRADIQRRNWRDNRKNIREIEKFKPQQQQQHQQQERPPSPETWRKPAEQPSPASPDANGLRFGKVASAVELAQAFSSSVSDQKTFSSQRGLPGRGQMPFTRLMGPGPRPQINGY